MQLLGDREQLVGVVKELGIVIRSGKGEIFVGLGGEEEVDIERSRLGI